MTLLTAKFAAGRLAIPKLYRYEDREAVCSASPRRWGACGVLISTMGSIALLWDGLSLVAVISILFGVSNLLNLRLLFTRYGSGRIATYLAVDGMK